MDKEPQWEGSKKATPPILVLRKYNYNYNEVYIYDGYILRIVDIILSKRLFNHRHISSTFT